MITIADEAQRRLTKRARRLLERRKHANKVVIAIARELVGFFWAALRVDREPARHGARTSAQFEGAKASAAPRSSPTRGRTKCFEDPAVGPSVARHERRNARADSAIGAPAPNSRLPEYALLPTKNDHAGSATLAS